MESKESKKNKKNYLIPDKTKEPDNLVKEPATVYGAQLFTYADYLSWPDDRMGELINGIVYAFSAPFRKHAHACSVFMVKVGSFITRRKGLCKIYTAPFDVRLPKNGETDDDKIYNVVQPDICVICDPSKLDDRGCIGAPDLIVEVFSPSTGKRDAHEKFLLYESSGVREYWLVYPENKAVNVFLLQPDGKYDEGTIYEVLNKQTKVPVHTLEGLIVDLEELFED